MIIGSTFANSEAELQTQYKRRAEEHKNQTKATINVSWHTQKCTHPGAEGAARGVEKGGEQLEKQGPSDENNNEERNYVRSFALFSSEKKAEESWSLPLLSLGDTGWIWILRGGVGDARKKEEQEKVNNGEEGSAAQSFVFFFLEETEELPPFLISLIFWT